MPNFDKQFILKGPCPIEVEAELQHLTSDEKALILKVMQNDLKFKESIAIKKEDKEIFSVNNSTCNICLTTNHNFECGLSFQFLDKINAIEKTNKCDFERFGVNYNETSKILDWKNETCNDATHTCCTSKTRNNNFLPKTSFGSNRQKNLSDSESSWLFV